MEKVLLIDSHTLWREGLKMLLATLESIEVIGEATSAQDAYQKANTLFPDLCIVNIAVSGDSIYETTLRLKEICPSTKVLVLMDKSEEHQVRALLDAKVDGLMSKTGAFEELKFAMKSALSGHRFLSPLLIDNVIERYLAHKDSSPEDMYGIFSALSRQEKRVLSCFCREIPPKAIAAELGISRKTVDIHKRNIKKKLGVDSDVGLIKLAIDKQFTIGPIFTE